MCRYCYSIESNIANKKNATKVIYRHPFFGAYCRVIFDPKRKFEIISNYLVKLPPSLVLLITLYAGQWNIPYLLAQCDIQLYNALKDQNYWHSMCTSWCNMTGYAYLRPYDEMLDDVSDMLMPNAMCPDNWKDYYHVSCMKLSWISKMNSKRKEMVSFIPLYKRLNNPRFGAERRFNANHDIYIVSDQQLLDYHQLEAIMSGSMIIKETSLSDAVVLTIRHHRSAAEKDLYIAILTIVSTSTSNKFISYQQVAVAVLEVSQLMSTGTSDMTMLIHISILDSVFSMPYEVYAIA